jgi:hypothetical protein
MFVLLETMNPSITDQQVYDQYKEYLEEFAFYYFFIHEMDRYIAHNVVPPFWEDLVSYDFTNLEVIPTQQTLLLSQCTSIEQKMEYLKVIKGRFQVKADWWAIQMIFGIRRST